MFYSQLFTFLIVLTALFHFLVFFHILKTNRTRYNNLSTVHPWTSRLSTLRVPEDQASHLVPSGSTGIWERIIKMGNGDVGITLNWKYTPSMVSGNLRQLWKLMCLDLFVFLQISTKLRYEKAQLHLQYHFKALLHGRGACDPIKTYEFWLKVGLWGSSID